MKQPYLVSKYGYHACSECGVRYSEEEYHNYYCIDKIVRYHINCKKCGAVFSEKPKRCYYEENNGKTGCPCGDSFRMEDGLMYCSRQLAVRREELRSWGCYYGCDDYKLINTGYKQLSFFEEE